MQNIRSLYAKISKNPRYLLEVSEEKMKELVESLIKIAKPEEKAELKVLYNAVVENTTAYQADPSSQNLKAWQSAKEVLAALIEQLSAKYSQEADDQPDGFDDIRKVQAYLVSRGFKISVSGIYQHQKENKVGKDKKTGRYMLPAVDKYAKTYLPLAATGKLIEDAADELQNKKIKAEIRKMEAQAEKEELSLKVSKGEYIAREEVVRELVGRGLILDSSLRHMLKTAVPEIIDLVGGDHNKTGQVMDELMTFIDDVMNSFASVDDFLVTLANDREDI